MTTIVIAVSALAITVSLAATNAALARIARALEKRYSLPNQDRDWP